MEIKFNTTHPSCEFGFLKRIISSIWIHIEISVGSININFEIIQKIFHSSSNEGVNAILSSVSRGREEITQSVRERTEEMTSEVHSVTLYMLVDSMSFPLFVIGEEGES